MKNNNWSCAVSQLCSRLLFSAACASSTKLQKKCQNICTFHGPPLCSKAVTSLGILEWADETRPRLQYSANSLSRKTSAGSNKVQGSKRSQKKGQKWPGCLGSSWFIMVHPKSDSSTEGSCGPKPKKRWMCFQRHLYWLWQFHSESVMYYQKSMLQRWSLITRVLQQPQETVKNVCLAWLMHVTWRDGGCSFQQPELAYPHSHRRGTGWPCSHCSASCKHHLRQAPQHTPDIISPLGSLRVIYLWERHGPFLERTITVCQTLSPPGHMQYPWYNQ